MKMSAPKVLTWLIAVIVGVVGILLKLGLIKIALISGFAFWLVVIGFGLLVLGTLFKGL
ncbi:MAG: hypothetical protein ONB05_12250 [candidate division KSB1 bacterium]|nr:hypothetical protein [candidate division KSB1 bacterium]